MDDDELDTDFGISNTQFAALDRDVTNKTCHQGSGNQVNAEVNDWSDDGFDDLTEEQYSALDQTIEEISENHQQNSEINSNNGNGSEVVEITASQFDLVSAIFDDDANEPMLEHLECLRSKFHHNQFRDKQWEIIDAVMNKKQDVCAVMATGYGKSLCFQFPAVFKNGMVLVISPLIALMEAQVLTLNGASIKACLVGTAQTDKHIHSRINRGEFNIIYSSPEFLQTQQGHRMLLSLKNRLTLVAIDESHCVSYWGHDFRTDYRRLNLIRDIIPDTPILALTATATAQVRHDIRSNIGLRNPREIVTGFDRPNLEFIVHEKSGNAWNDLGQWVTHMTSGSVIIYVLKRKETEEIANKLLTHGIECRPYHAGMPIIERKQVLKEFLDGSLNVIVATIAFGMGIDKKDVRTIVHYGATKNLESYYQEVGRAGRDGLPSKVVTYFDIEDFNLHDWFLENEFKKEKLSNFVKRNQRELAMYIREFVHSPKCRRKTILEYFGEDVSSLTVRSDCCDNCAKGLSTWRLKDLYIGIDDNGLYDFSRDARILLGAMLTMETNNIDPGRDDIVKLLKGTKYYRSGMLTMYHGLGRARKPYYWNALIDQLTKTDYIEFVPGKSYLTLSSVARTWLRDSKQLKQIPHGAMFRFFERKPNTPLSNVHWNQTYSDNLLRVVYLNDSEDEYSFGDDMYHE